jgi:hypothetical protein
MVQYKDGHPPENLLVMTAHDGEEARTRKLIREIKQAALAPDAEQDSIVINRQCTLRELNTTKPEKYENSLSVNL